MPWLDIIGAICSLSRMFWSFASATYLLKRMGFIPEVPQIAKALHHELRPFILTMLATEVTIDMIAGEMGWAVFNLLLGSFAYWVYKDIGKDDDDDRWKRRKAKLKEKVETLNGKLVVVPQGV